MKEQVGKVTLNYQWYSGKDLYCDGPIEDTMLEIASTYGEDELNGVIARSNSWEILYHFSHIRQNIVSWLPITSRDNVLEIGAGCGAITGALADLAGTVTCIELSKKRSLINANRNCEKDNIEIMVGNFMDIEPNLPMQYDYITLIGVFEYADSYIGGEDPYETFLRTIARHLKPDGKIIIAIENQMGLKYWAGCVEDHVGKFFEGIEGYHHTEGVRTFSRSGMEELLEKVGLTKYKFYYPYPDYKFPTSIYSDEYLPKVGELNKNMNNLDRERIVLFDEGLVFDRMIREGLFPLYSNSFLIMTEQGED
ncbi:MAG: class I SAM-dependent methyltransferase [Lachnospiraceae bacterium]|nr:class I SAM-dependent methyltransferase [Lachnospiraceae bacterium]